MKKFLIGLFLLLAGQIYAQKSYTYFQAGYNVSQHPFTGLNYAIFQYDSARNGQAGNALLTKKMGGLHFTDGFSGAIGNLNAETGLQFDLRYLQRKGSAHSEGVDTGGNPGTRDLEVSCHSFNTALGYTLINSGLMDVCIGGSMDLLLTGAKTRRNADPFQKIDVGPGNVNLAFSPYAQVHFTLFHLGLYGRAWYQFAVLRSDYYDVAQAISPNTTSLMNDDQYKSVPNNFGIEIGAMIYFSKKKMNSQKLIRGKDVKKN